MQDTNYSEDIANEIRSSVRGGEEPNDLSDYAQTILNVLRESSEPVGRSNVMGRGRMTAGEWSMGINELKSQNLVVQTGNRRTAKYSVA